MKTDNSLRLPDGRNLFYAEFGKPDGYPVLYFHGTPSSRLEPLLFAENEVIARLGLRMIPPEEMTSLSPEVEDKRIEVDTRQQMVYAYEDGELAFSTQCTIGASFSVDGLGLVDFTTPSYDRLSEAIGWI